MAPDTLQLSTLFLNLCFVFVYIYILFLIFSCLERERLQSAEFMFEKYSGADVNGEELCMCWTGARQALAVLLKSSLTPNHWLQLTFDLTADFDLWLYLIDIMVFRGDEMFGFEPV